MGLETEPVKNQTKNKKTNKNKSNQTNKNNTK